MSLPVRARATSRRSSSSPAAASTIGTHRVDFADGPGPVRPVSLRACASPCTWRSRIFRASSTRRAIRLVIDAADEAAARAQVDEMCQRLLANPVIEAYEIAVREMSKA
ncbi:MAG: phosphoribosylformylglycinamidine synthase subunit PurS [Actinobacteria bacterium]|nr:MAG: phosphoribosylformylglycinamidine synthase subunit PurS [Actinomycetota bacterium]